jgi:hypothetical protein
MPDIDKLLFIVVGVQLTAELGDRPLAYRVEAEAKRLLAQLLPPRPPDQPPLLSPVVISDAYYLSDEGLQDQPLISIGGPGVNSVAESLLNDLPSAVSIDHTLLIQLDVEGNDLRASVWGMNHLSTVRAVDLFLTKGYLETLLKNAVAALDQD